MNGDAVAIHLALQAFAHEFAGFRAGRGGTLIWIVIGFVADVTSLRIVRKRHARLHQMIKLPQRADALGQSQVVMHASGGGQAFGKILGAVGHVRACAHLVIRLLVRSAHPRCAQPEPGGDDGDFFLRIFHAFLRHEFVKMHRAIHPRRARADNERVIIMDRYVLIFYLDCFHNS